jgi:hypothetical protein
MSKNTIITVTNVTADLVLTLKPKQFWDLASDVLTAVAPLLRAKAKECEAIYRAAQDAGKASYGSDAYAQWDLACKCRDWAEKAERLPKKRIEDAAKAERAKAKAAKAKDQKERVRYLTPATTLIAESLVSVRDHIASRKFAALNHLAKYIRGEFVKFQAANPVTHNKSSAGDYTWTSGKTWNDFWHYSLDRQTRAACVEFNAERVLLAEVVGDTYRTPAAERILKAEHLTERSLQAEAKSYADLVVGSYAYRVADRTAARHQVATKENKAAITACVSDNKTIWDGAIITVTCGSHQYRFSTSCIVNFSKYGKAFNQWPTREIASSHEDETTLEKWSA